MNVFLICVQHYIGCIFHQITMNVCLISCIFHQINLHHHKVVLSQLGLCHTPHTIIAHWCFQLLWYKQISIYNTYSNSWNMYDTLNVLLVGTLKVTIAALLPLTMHFISITHIILQSKPCVPKCWHYSDIVTISIYI